MRYVDGYVLPLPKKNIKAYLPMARLGKRIWMKHGALDYKECVGDDLKAGWGVSFPKAMGCAAKIVGGSDRTPPCR